MSNENDQTSNIDRAIAAAKARKAVKNAAGLSEGKGSSPASTEPKAKRSKMSEEEKAAKALQKETAKNAQRVLKLEARAAKKAAKEANRKTPHLTKVEKAASKLPTLADNAQVLFNDATVNLSREQVSALASWLNHFNRTQATQRALTQKLTKGLAVKIVSGDPRFIGMTGEVTRAQRIRCYVAIPGVKRELYCFTSDVELVAAEAARTGTEG